jgi:GlcNAc-PI de-N-acetylase
MRKSSSEVRYYVAAHQDDWQLFYGQQAFADLSQPGARVVFVYTTAGDAGGPDAWWQARERGALAAQASPTGGAPPAPETIDINGHAIAVYDADSFISYHLRLPDGNLQGDGFPATGFVSLESLHVGCIGQLAALDRSTVYHGWDDFCATLGAIFDRERGSATPWVNAADWSWKCSPEDHSDHKTTANALRKIFCQRGNSVHRLWFATYSNDDRPANLEGEPLQHKQSVYLAYRRQVEHMVDPAFLDDEWKMWGAKNYTRRVAAGERDTGE